MEAAPNPEGGDRKRKRRKLDPAPSRWRTDVEQWIYSSRLLEALRRVRRPSPSAPPRGRAVRDAADRALAFSARGRTRWSRAILLSARRAMRRKAAWRRPRVPPPPCAPVATAAAIARAEAAVPVLEKKAKVLGSLVPGCRKLSFPTLLDETSDYIAALQMQVRAMTALADALSAVGSHVAPLPPPQLDQPSASRTPPR